MYVCESCGSTEHVVAYFQTLVKREYDSSYQDWRGPELTNEEEREPIKVECENCYSSTTDPDSWYVHNADRAFQCATCGDCVALEEYGYCEACEPEDDDENDD